MAPTCSESVVRFFDNGEKPVVRLRFDGVELVCTPEHPFYVVGKGWTRAAALAVGDLALNASGGRVAFLGREAVDGTRRVYNIEVADAHTYFVGNDGGVLAHNKCDEDGDDALRESVVLPDFPLYDQEFVINMTRKVKSFWRSKDVRYRDIYPSVNMDNYIANINNLKNRIKSIGSIENLNKAGLTEEDYMLGICNLNYFEKLHFITRTEKNRTQDFLFVNLNLLSKPEDKELVEKGGKVRAYFLGEQWVLLQNNKSRFHSVKGDGSDCYKWCSESGRELVIFLDNDVFVLEVNPERIGTYNVFVPSGGRSGLAHFVVDIAPYLYFQYLSSHSVDGNILDPLFIQQEAIKTRAFRDFNARYIDVEQEVFNSNFKDIFPFFD